jgi:HAD superfamily hydrolase (TIGR01456 family)
MVTNGGGKTEKDRIAELSERLDVPVSESQFLQCHTPFKALVPQYRRVLVVGGDADRCRHVAKSYGFKEVVMPVDIVKAHPSVWPFHRFQKEELIRWSDSSIDVHGAKFNAVLVFTDPRDMGVDTQIVLDLVMSENGVLGTRRHQHSPIPAIPIHFSNNDLLWANDYPVPRYGQGAFKTIVDSLYEQTTGHKLQSFMSGKPYRSTYEFADRLLQGLADGKSHRQVYMVGDNPASDIIGAHNYGWNSLLVRTGVYRNGTQLPVQPTKIVNDVLEAVKWVIQTT